VVTGAIVRQPDDTILGVILPPFEAESTGDFARDVQQVTQRIVDRLEEWLRSYPDQWYMFRRMWTPQPSSA
jgi:KDO2-lipid IV(A) lauroyltransferase